jgi:uncharacterized protein YndB with AHSA1/START domain
MKLDLTFDQLIPKPIEAVWRALTDPATLARWLMENDFQPRVGHKFTMREAPAEGCRGSTACEVLELDPPRRMVWSWNGGMDGEVPTRVIFELRAEGAGTRLVLRHEGEATPPQSQSVRGGWTRKMASLSRLLAGDDDDPA